MDYKAKLCATWWARGLRLLPVFRHLKEGSRGENLETFFENLRRIEFTSPPQ
jgi:hypothetical protein